MNEILGLHASECHTSGPPLYLGLGLLLSGGPLLFKVWPPTFGVRRGCPRYAVLGSLAGSLALQLSVWLLKGSVLIWRSQHFMAVEGVPMRVGILYGQASASRIEHVPAVCGAEQGLHNHQHGRFWRRT